MTPYEKWLIEQRVFCEKCAAPIPAVRVVKEKGRDTVVCDKHTNEYEKTQQTQAQHD